MKRQDRALSEPTTSRSWKRAFSEIADLQVFIQLVQIGFSHGLEAADWVHLKREVARVLKEDDPFPTESEQEAARSHGERLQRFAERQRDRRYSFLYNMSATKLWSVLETCVDSLACKAFQDPASWADPELIRGLQGTLLEFLDSSEEERAELLCYNLKLKVQSGKKRGVGKFEAILSPLGLGGPIDDGVRRSIFELSEVRNVIVHRGGLADRRFASSCPWLNLAPGQEIRLSEDDYRLYEAAAKLYVLGLNNRLHAQNGSTPSDFQVEVQREIAEGHALLVALRTKSPHPSIPAENEEVK